MDEIVVSEPSGELPISGQKLGMIVSAMESSALVVYDSAPGQQILEGDIDGLGFRVRMPHLRKGKHANVGIVDINDVDGSVYSFVLRNKSHDAKKHQEIVKNHPGVRGLLPRQYDIVGDWVVLERLQGLELEELLDRMDTDSDFVVKYAEEAWSTIQSVLGEGLETQDVRFAIGHNVMVNPESAKVRLIEQTSLSKSPRGYSGNERLTRMLMNELEGANEYSDSQLQFLISLFGKAIEVNDPNQLFVRGRAIKKGHPDFEDIWKSYYGGSMILKSEGNDKPWYLEQRTTEPPETLGFWEQGVTRTFSPAFWDSVNAGSVEGLRDVLNSGAGRAEITDPNDFRSRPILII